MIEVRELDARGTLEAAASCLAEQLRLDARQLTLAAHWADLHHPDSLPPPIDTWEERRRPARRRPRRPARRRRHPADLANRPAGLGLVLQTSALAAKHLIADALDLRHHLPRLWVEVQHGRVRAWKALRVAHATRHLPLAVMGQVDRGLAGLLPTLPWSGFETILDATVKTADPVGARLAEAEAASRRFVALGRDGGHGLTTLIARGEVLDILTFLAAVNRIADLLAVEGDTDTVEVRRSKAVGILGQPDRALTLLTAHQHDTDQPPTTTEQHGGWRRPGPANHDAGEADEGKADDDTGEESEPAPDEPGERSLDLTGSAPVSRVAAEIRVQLYVHLTDAALRGEDRPRSAWSTASDR